MEYIIEQLLKNKSAERRSYLSKRVIEFHQWLVDEWGLEEIEFYVQWLQLKHSGSNPQVLVQSTPSAIHRLGSCGAISQHSSKLLSFAYEYYRKLETLMRLNQEKSLKEETDVALIAARFMGHADVRDLLGHLRSTQQMVLKAIKSD